VLEEGYAQCFASALAKLNVDLVENFLMLRAQNARTMLFMVTVPLHNSTYVTIDVTVLSAPFDGTSQLFRAAFGAFLLDF
jgi:hypothetical protein